MTNDIFGENKLCKCNHLIFSGKLIRCGKNCILMFRCLWVVLCWHFHLICVTQCNENAFCHTVFELYCFMMSLWFICCIVCVCVCLWCNACKLLISRWEAWTNLILSTLVYNSAGTLLILVKRSFGINRVQIWKAYENNTLRRRA